MSSPPDGSAVSSARERLVEAASILFYRFGYQAVGVDRIVSDSGVAKMTLYRHFASKDDLIVEYLERYEAEFWEWFAGAAAEMDDPLQSILAIFTALEERCRSARCVGCPFQAAAAEFPDRDHPAHRAARAHKEELRRRLARMAKDVGTPDPDAIANQLALIMEGALASVRLLALPVPAREARTAAEAILLRSSNT